MPNFRAREVTAPSTLYVVFFLLAELDDGFFAAAKTMGLGPKLL